MTAPPYWLETLVDLIGNAMEPHSFSGPLGYRYRHDTEDELWEVMVYPTPVSLEGGPEDSAVVSPGFTLDLMPVLDAFEALEAVYWTAQSLDPYDSLSPSVAIEGRYQEHDVFLQILAEAPEDEPPGAAVTIPTSEHGTLH